MAKLSMSCKPLAGSRRLLLLALAVVAGCGGEAKLAPVTGTVTIAGKPYPGGKVLFTPVAEGDAIEAGRAAFGIPDENGRFELSTYRQSDGALIGEHTVQLLRAADDSQTRPDLARLDFRRVTLPSGRVSVAAGDNQVDIALSIEELKQYGNRL